ncbi:MAG: class I SAM-dependent methyltransferase [Candidatus Coatesbacteria bacterium]|nr:class I SAM-dependent methyltransferase [Candidatus Coatesbacteria bacterium]
MENKEYRRLHAEWYEYVSGGHDQSKEIEFWMNCIEEAGGPVLEVGSGTGRILVPLLERGVDIVGLDTSDNMMARCRAMCETKGLKAELHKQSILDFDLSQKFGLVVFGSGGLGLFLEEEEIKKAFERVMAHLRPGGLFIFEYEPVRKAWDDERKWWGDWVCGPDNIVIAWRNRNKYDPVTHIWTRLFVLDKFVDGVFVESEANERYGRFFTEDEARRYALDAGFVDVRLTDWLTDAPPNESSKVVTVRCRKPN